MKRLTDITVEDLNRLTGEVGADLLVISRDESKHVEYALRQAIGLALAFERYEASGNVTGAVAFGMAIGLALQDE